MRATPRAAHASGAPPVAGARGLLQHRLPPNPSQRHGAEQGGRVGMQQNAAAALQRGYQPRPFPPRRARPPMLTTRLTVAAEAAARAASRCSAPMPDGVSA
jgi:hypothetical protein